MITNRASATRIRGGVGQAFIAALCLLAAAAVPDQAAALELGDLEVGARAGGSFGWLYRPKDPVGAPTLVYGTAFRGGGLIIGPTARASLWESAGAKLSGRADLLYGFQSGRGFAEDVEGGERIDAVIRAHSLRVPLMLEISNGWEAGGLSLAAGPELVVGLAASATIEQSGPDGERQSPMSARAPSYLGATMALGYTFDRPEFSVPIELVANWNPLVADATVDRFEGYQSFEQPRSYTATFNWQLMLSVGARWSLDK